MFGFHNRGGFDIPEWALKLREYYWVIRVEGRNKVKRRRYYRYVEKEKLRLAEMGIYQPLILAVCKYLVNLSVVSGNKMHEIMAAEVRQLSFDFNANNFSI